MRINSIKKMMKKVRFSRDSSAAYISNNKKSVTNKCGRLLYDRRTSFPDVCDSQW